MKEIEKNNENNFKITEEEIKELDLTEEEVREFEKRLREESFTFHFITNEEVDCLIDIYNGENITKEKVKVILNHIEKFRDHLLNITIDTSKSSPYVIQALSTKLWTIFKDAGITINFANIVAISRLMYVFFEQDKFIKEKAELIKNRLKNGKFEYEDYLPVDKD